MIAGLIGFVLSVLTPLLPVVQTTATLNWPQGGQVDNVTAPLITLTPVTMTATVPCDVIRDDAAARRHWCSAPRPPNAKDAALNALFVNVTQHTRVNVTDRNVVVASVPRAEVVVAASAAHRDHLVRGGHVRDVRRADRSDRRQGARAPDSPTPTCGRTSSASSPT